MAGTTRGIQQRLLNLGNDRLQELAMELMQNERFQQAFATAFGKAMSARQQMNRNVSLVLSALQVPTQEDVERLSRRVDKLNGELKVLNERLAGLEDGARKSTARSKSPAKKRPARKKAARKKAPSSR